MRVDRFIHRFALSLLILLLACFSHAQNPQWEWAKSFGTGGWEIARQVVADQNTHHVYVVGDWEDDLSSTFPGGVNPSTQFTSSYGFQDGFVAKYDQDGTLVWAFKVGGGDDDQINSIDLDQDGNIYITGFVGEGSSIYFSGTSPHSGSSIINNTSDQDFFLAKYNPDGEFIWVRRSETDFGRLAGRDVTLGPDAVYAVGRADGWATFGPLFMSNTPNGNDIFLVKYSLDGVEQWIAEAGSNANDLVNEVVADESHVYYIGQFEGSNLNIRNAGGGAASSVSNAQNGFSDIVLVSYDQNGTYYWSQSIGSQGNDEGQGMTQDADSLYITGAIDDNASFPAYANNPLPTSANMDVFVSSHAKSDGNTGWVHVLPCTDGGDERGLCMDVDASGNLFVIGDFKSDLHFPEGVTLSAISGDDVFVAAYAGHGAFRWAESAGSSLKDEGRGLAVGPAGSLYISGRHDNQMNLGSLTLPDNPGRNGFLAKLQNAVPLPTNDTPCRALLLPVGDTCASEIHTNLGATDSGIPDPGCADYAGADLWFKAIVPASGNLFVRTGTTNDNIYPPVDGYMWRVAMALYTGDCQSLIQEGCFVNNSAYNSRASSAFLFDQIPGDTVWIRLWEPFGNQNGLFSICSYDPGHYPGWDLPDFLCGENGLIDLDSTLSDLKVGFIDQVIDAVGITDQGNILGAPDGSGAQLFDEGDRIILDLTDTIPAGETYTISFRSFLLNIAETQLVLKTSLDNISYVDHSFMPETFSDIYHSSPITAEHPTRYLWIENMAAGGGGFAIDGIKYFFRGTRGGSWSGPGVTGSIFDPAGLVGPVSISYSVGGSAIRSDSTRVTTILNSDAGSLGSDTTVCLEHPDLNLVLQDYNGMVIKWESSDDGFLSTTPIPITDAFLNISGLVQSTSFRAIVQDGSCDPDTSNELTVTVLEIPLANPGPFGDVCGSSLGLQAIPSIGTGVWSLTSGPGTATFTPSENDPSVRVDVDQYGTYFFSWTETNGICSDDSVIEVSFFEIPVSNAGTGGEWCGSAFQLSAATSTGTGLWTSSSGPGTASFAPSPDRPDAIVSVDLPGIYWLTWTETNDICEDADSIEVQFVEHLEPDVGENATVCGMQHDLSALPEEVPGIWVTSYGPGNASFSPSETTSRVSVTVDAFGEYLFRWEARQGFCSGKDSVIIVFYPVPVSDAGPDQVLDYKFSTYLQAVIPETGTGTWTHQRGSGLISDPNDPATLVSGLDLGENEFNWTITSEFCPAVSDLVKITVHDVETNTVITPNNDGLNDVLVFPGTEGLTACEIIIYNRWGTEVYRNENYQNNWDGKDHKDRLLIEDTYYYILRIPPDRIIKSFVEIRRSSR